MPLTLVPYYATGSPELRRRPRRKETRRPAARTVKSSPATARDVRGVGPRQKASHTQRDHIRGRACGTPRPARRTVQPAAAGAATAGRPTTAARYGASGSSCIEHPGLSGTGGGCAVQDSTVSRAGLRPARPMLQCTHSPSIAFVRNIQAHGTVACQAPSGAYAALSRHAPPPGHIQRQFRLADR